MDALAQLIGRDCVLWWQDTTGERCKTNGVLQRDGESARPYRVGYIDFGVDEAQHAHGANIFLSGRIELAVVSESDPGVALAMPKSLADARKEAKRLSNDHDDICIIRAWAPAADKVIAKVAVEVVVNA